MKNKGIWWKLGLSFVLTLGLHAAGAAWAAGNESRENTAALCFMLCGLVIVLLLIMNWQGTRRFAKKMNLTVAQQQEFLLSRSAEARENLHRSIHRLKRLRQIIMVYIIFAFLLSAALTFWMGASGNAGLSVLGLYLFYGFVCRIRHTPEKKLFEHYTKPEDYPQLHALCRRAAEEFGLRRRIRIILLPGCNAGIARLGRCISVQLGVGLLDILGEEELYSVLLHEFGHLSPEANPQDREIRLLNYLYTDDMSFFNQFSTLLFRWCQVLYAFEFDIYRLTANVVIEEIADAAVRSRGQAENLAAALQKINYYDLYSSRMSLYVKELFFEPETPWEDWQSRLAAGFREAMGTQRECWDAMAAAEIQPRSASHPILRCRLEQLGVENIHSTLPNDEGGYRAECRKALKELDGQTVDEAEYAQLREEQYLKPLRHVQQWEEALCPFPTPEELPELVTALHALERYEEAEALCNRQIEELGECAVTAFAIHYKGVRAAFRYEKEAIRLLYKAAEINRNYVDSALDEIGALCCSMGWQEELDEYRQRAVEMGQKQADERSGDPGLNKKAAVFAPDIDPLLRDALLENFVSVGADSLRAIHLVQQEITEDYRPWCFVLEFEESAEEEQRQKVYDRVFRILDNREENFMLSVYDEEVAGALKKVEGSCVWRKD